MNFEHDYVEFDALGLARLLCMSCAVPIAERRLTNIPGVVRPGTDQPIQVVNLEKTAAWRDVAVDLSDGTYTNLKLCDKCEHVDLLPHLDKCMGQIQRAWVMEDKFARVSEFEYRANAQRRAHLRILGRATHGDPK